MLSQLPLPISNTKPCICTCFFGALENDLIIITHRNIFSQNNNFDIMPIIFEVGVIMTNKQAPKPASWGKCEVPKVFFYQQLKLYFR